MLAIVVLIGLPLAPTQALAAGEPVICVEKPDGWVDNHYEDENIRISFDMANLRTYIRIINKTDKIMLFSWPAASFLLPDGTARTLCFMYEKVVSDGNEKVPLSPMEKQREALPPGVISVSKLVSKNKTVLIPGSDGLLIPSGCAIFCQLGFNSSRYAAKAGGSVKGLIPELTELSYVAESEFFQIISEFGEGSIFEWTLQYDFAGSEKTILVRLRMQ